MTPGAQIIGCEPCRVAGRGAVFISVACFEAVRDWSRNPARSRTANELRAISDDENLRFLQIERRYRRSRLPPGSDAFNALRSVVPPPVLRPVPRPAPAELVLTPGMVLCPNPACGAPCERPRGHHCHHISPGTGCPGCHTHFCFACLTVFPTSTAWASHYGRPPTNCGLFCDESCPCVDCAECRPGHPCSTCEGSGSCYSCHPERRPRGFVPRPRLPRPGRAAASGHPPAQPPPPPPPQQVRPPPLPPVIERVPREERLAEEEYVAEEGGEEEGDAAAHEHDLELSLTVAGDVRRCSICAIDQPAGAPVFCCRPCNYDECQRCFMAGGSQHTAHAHDLALSLSRAAAPRRCSICSANLPAGAPVFRCVPCNYDECERCFMRGASVQMDAPPYADSAVGGDVGRFL